MRVLTIMLAAGVIVLSTGDVRGGIDFHASQGGGDSPSTSYKDFRHANLEQLLMKFNNDILVDESWQNSSVGLLTEGDKDALVLGELQRMGNGNYLKTYDRLLARSVMRILMFHPGSFAEFPPDKYFRSPPYRPIESGYLKGFTGSNGGGGRNASTPPSFNPPTAVPEPAAVALIGVAMVVLVGGRRTRRTRRAA